MPSTLRKQILDERAAALAAIASPAGLTVERNRDSEPGESAMPLLVMFDGGHRNEATATGETTVTMGFTVQGYVTTVRAEDEQAVRDALATALDDLYGAVVLALQSDPSAGGLALDTVETEFADPVFVLDDCDTPFAIFAVDFAVTFTTAEKSPYSH